MKHINDYLFEIGEHPEVRIEVTKHNLLIHYLVVDLLDRTRLLATEKFSPAISPDSIHRILSQADANGWKS